MTSFTLIIPNLDEEVQARLRIRAARHGRSIESEIRSILIDAVEITAVSDRPKIVESAGPEFGVHDSGLDGSDIAPPSPESLVSPSLTWETVTEDQLQQTITDGNRLHNFAAYLQFCAHDPWFPDRRAGAPIESLARSIRRLQH